LAALPPQGIVKGAICHCSRQLRQSSLKEAQQAVIDAIYALHKEGKFCEILASIRAEAVPRWLEYVFPAERGKRCRFSDHDRQYEDALKAVRQWARRYHLTRREDERLRLLGSSRIGPIDEEEANPEQPVEWVLEWGKAILEAHELEISHRVAAIPITPWIKGPSPGTLLSSQGNCDSPTQTTPLREAQSGPSGALPTSGSTTDVPLPDMPPPAALHLELNQGGASADESWGQFKERVMREVESQLKAIFEETKAIRESKPKRAYHRKRKSDHYRWFVLYQCAGWSYDRIAEKVTGKGECSTIRKGVGKVAAELGVTLSGNWHSKNRLKFPP
jgi:hypothetical protein